VIRKNKKIAIGTVDVTDAVIVTMVTSPQNQNANALDVNLALLTAPTGVNAAKTEKRQRQSDVTVVAVSRHHQRQNVENDVVTSRSHPNAVKSRPNHPNAVKRRPNHPNAVKRRPNHPNAVKRHPNHPNAADLLLVILVVAIKITTHQNAAIAVIEIRGLLNAGNVADVSPSHQNVGVDNRNHQNVIAAIAIYLPSDVVTAPHHRMSKLKMNHCPLARIPLM